MGSPLRIDRLGCQQRRPHLAKHALEWATFQFMRRTHASLMKELEVDPKLVADQQGHTPDVNQNVYTKSPIHVRKRALSKLEARLLAA